MIFAQQGRMVGRDTRLVEVVNKKMAIERPYCTVTRARLMLRKAKM